VTQLAGGNPPPFVSLHSQPLLELLCSHSRRSVAIIGPTMRLALTLEVQKKLRTTPNLSEKGSDENRKPSRSWVSLSTVNSETATELSSPGGLLRRGGWPRGPKPLGPSLNVGGIIARLRLLHGFARLC
jgi:hypothetical protein